MFDPPEWLTIALVNGISIPVIQLSVAWLGTLLPDAILSPNLVIYAVHSIEIRLYERLFFIRLWKDRLPDGGPWVGGSFPKSRLRSLDSAYLMRYQLETCRGELVHWAQLLISPIFVLWNPPWAFGVVVGYFIVTDLPCILVQRYNRQRMRRVTGRFTEP